MTDNRNGMPPPSGETAMRKFACSYIHNERLWGFTITARNWQDAERAAALTIRGSWVAGEIVHEEDAPDELVRAVKETQV